MDNLPHILFLTYINRSGSTFLANIISKHPNVLVCPEAEILIRYFLKNPLSPFNFYDCYKDIAKMVKKDKKLKTWGLKLNYDCDLKNSETYFDALIAILQCYKNKVKPNASYILFKGTQLINIYTKLSDTLKKKYSVGYISLIRDPRAVFSSQRRTISPATKKPMNINPIKAALQWNAFTYKCYSYSNNSDFFCIKYERLIENTITEINSLFDFFNIKYPEHLIERKSDLYERLPLEYKKIHEDIVENANAYRIRSWRKELPSIYIALIENITKKNLETQGYVNSNTKTYLIGFYIAKLYFNILIFIDNVELRLKKILKRFISL